MPTNTDQAAHDLSRHPVAAWYERRGAVDWAEAPRCAVMLSTLCNQPVGGKSAEQPKPCGPCADP